MADWMQKGYVWPESTISEETTDNLMKQKLVFSAAIGSEDGIEKTKTDTYGFEVVAIKLNDGMVKTAQPGGWGIGVPVTSEEPEAAVRFINMMYTDSTLMDYMVYGTEGDDYTLENGLIKPVEGGHFNTAAFMIGNNALLTPLASTDADFYKRVDERNRTAVKSEYLGFVIDTTGMDLLRSQINAVLDQYNYELHGGGYTEEAFQEYVSKLEVAGLQEYIDQVQTQLDAWLADK